VAVIAQQYLREVGIDARVTLMESRALFARIDPPRYEFDAYLLNAPGDLDPHVLWHSSEIDGGLNNIGFRHPRVDELAELSTRLMERGERAAVLKEIWQILAEQQPNSFLFFPEAFYAIRNDVRGFKAHPRLITHRAHEWWLER
jgi:peptide/nickel transport system substrate-binding protein